MGVTREHPRQDKLDFCEDLSFFFFRCVCVGEKTQPSKINWRDFHAFMVFFKKEMDVHKGQFFKEEVTAHD